MNNFNENMLLFCTITVFCYIYHIYSDLFNKKYLFSSKTAVTKAIKCNYIG